MSGGRFITFEGGEGAGKSTQLPRLADSLQQRGLPILLTREPGGSEGAEEIRRLLVEGEPGRWDPITETLLHFAARRDHLVKTVWPALAEGTWVLCDRFADFPPAPIKAVVRGCPAGSSSNATNSPSACSVPI